MHSKFRLLLLASLVIGSLALNVFLGLLVLVQNEDIEKQNDSLNKMKVEFRDFYEKNMRLENAEDLRPQSFEYSSDLNCQMRLVWSDESELLPIQMKISVFDKNATVTLKDIQFPYLVLMNNENFVTGSFSANSGETDSFVVEKQTGKIRFLALTPSSNTYSTAIGYCKNDKKEE